MRNQRRVLLLLVALTISLFTMAQNSKELTLQHLMPGGRNYSSIVAKNIKQLQFAGDNYIYVSGNKIIYASLPDGKESTLITKQDIDLILSSVKADTLKSIPQIFASEEGGAITIRFNHKGKAYKSDSQAKKTL